MWKAEKIELKTLGEAKHPQKACNEEWMVLFINGEYEN